MLTIHAVPAFNDNYIWLIQAANSPKVLIIDPGDAEPVFDAIAQYQLEPLAILITHGCHDHIDGITSIIEQYQIPVYGSKIEGIPHLSHAVTASESLLIDDEFPAVTILDLPGHTRGHIAFLIEDALFCGDTLFGAGCGRLHSGTVKQLYNSLQKIAQLPDTTKIYCAHEYTQANLHFAAAVEPNNLAIQQRIKDTAQLRKKEMPSLPSDLALERATNPFLRCDQADVIASAQRSAGKPLHNPVDVFTALRSWKDKF